MASQRLVRCDVRPGGPTAEPQVRFVPLEIFGLWEYLMTSRHGFEVRGWSLMDDELGVSYPFIYSTGPKGIKVHYREWLASAIQQRAKERKRREKA